MKIKVEASGLAMVNNAITESIKTGNWGVRISFVDDTARFDAVLTPEACEDLIFQIRKTFASIDRVDKSLGREQNIHRKLEQLNDDLTLNAKLIGEKYGKD